MSPLSITRSRTLPKLVAPSAIARSLEWRKHTNSVLSVHVGGSIINLAATWHPSLEEQPIHSLPSVPMQVESRKNKKMLKTHVLEEISDVAREHNTCGMVVSWPVQKEGWCGAPCGKVLHILDQMMQETEMELPVCLWNGRHWTSGEDEWGRAAVYAVPSSKSKHVASKEQYQEEGMKATGIAQDFLAHHWPNFTRHHHTKGEYNSEPAQSKKAPMWDGF